MLKNCWQQLARALGINSDRRARRLRSKRSALVLEYLESRDLPAPLSWAAGVNLPTAEGGIVAAPSGSNLLALAGPTTTSYNVSATDPTWLATVAHTHQPLD